MAVLGRAAGNTPKNQNNPTGNSQLAHTTGFYIDIFFHHSTFFASMLLARLEPEPVQQRYVARR